MRDEEEPDMVGLCWQAGREARQRALIAALEEMERWLATGTRCCSKPNLHSAHSCFLSKQVLLPYHF